MLTLKILGALTVSLVAVLDGLLWGFPTIALANIKLTEYQGSWLAAIGFACGIIVTPFGGAISGWLGRKKTLLIFSPIVSLGWLLIGRELRFRRRGSQSSRLGWGDKQE